MACFAKASVMHITHARYKKQVKAFKQQHFNESRLVTHTCSLDIFFMWSIPAGWIYPYFGSVR